MRRKRDLGLSLRDKHCPSFSEGVVLLLRGLLFLAAAVVAAVGYLQKRTSVSLEVPEEIRVGRDRIVAWRRRFGVLAFVMFLVAIVAAAVVAGLPAYSFGQAPDDGSGMGT